MPSRFPVLNTRPKSATVDGMRPSAAKRGYDRRWQRTRSLKLAQHPFCEDCETIGIVRAAEEVDHIDGKGPLGERGHDLTNLRALCKSCHSKKTAREDGGLGHRKATT